MKPSFRPILRILAAIILFAAFTSVTAIAQVTIFNETFPNTSAAWNGTNQNNAGWVVYQGNSDADDVRVATISSKTGLMFDDCDQGFIASGNAYDAAYININLTGYHTITITYDRYDVGTDAGEGHKLEYSTNSTNGVDGTWTTLNSVLNGSEGAWNNALGPFSIPNSAAVSNFKIRFTGKSNSAGENTYIDNVLVRGTACALSASSTTVNIACFGNSTGSIDLTPSSGTAPYTYLWTGGATSQDISSKAAGTYTVTITDANLCTMTHSKTLTQPAAALSASPTVVNELFGSTDGSVSLSVSGGTSPYTYLWSNAATSQNISSLSAGTYNVTVTDANSCTTTTGGTVTNIAISSFAKYRNLTVDKTKVSGGSNLTDFPVMIKLSGNYLKTTGNGGDIQNANGYDIVFSGVCGTPAYSFQVEKYNGTTGDLVAWVRVPSSSVSQNTIIRMSYGSAAVTADRSSTNTWTSNYDGIWHLDNNFSDVTSNAQNATNNGSSAATGNIDQGQDFDGVSDYVQTPSSDLKTANNFTISTWFKADATDLAHVLIWQGDVAGNGFGNPQQEMHINLGSWTTVYTNDTLQFFLGDIGIDVSNDVLNIVQPFSDKTSWHHVAAVVKNLSTSPAAELFLDGVSVGTDVGVANSHTSRSNWDTDLRFGRPGAATRYYDGKLDEVRISNTALSSDWIKTEYNNQSNPGTFFTTSSEYLTLAASIAGTNVSCFGGSNGALNLTASGGGGSYTFLWTTGSTAEDLAGVSAGSYTVTVTDAISCTVSASTTLTQPAEALSATSTTVNVTGCYGNSNGSIDLTPSGGTSPYTYSWTGGATTQDISGKAAGSYTVTITDANSCTLTHSKTLTEPAALGASSATVNISCFGGSDGSIDLTPSGGTSPYTYSWTGGATTQDISSKAAGTYTVTITDANSCTLTHSKTLTQPAAAISSTFSVTDATTHGGNDGSISQTVSGGTAPYIYNWSNGAGTKNISGLTAGTYFVTITDDNSCTFTNSATVNEPGVCPCTWLGTSNDWHTSSNWDCGFVPTDTCNAIIASGTPFNCNIQNNAACKNLTIQPSATLVITGTNQLDIHGSLTNNGTFTRGSSVVRFVGTSEQHIYGTKQTDFWNVHIVNTSGTGLRLHKSVGVYGDMRLLDGYVFTGTDTVKMESDNQGCLLVFSDTSFIAGKLRRKINNSGHHGYEFPVGDAGSPARFFRATIKTHNLQGTTCLTVWFDTLQNHSDVELANAYVEPPANINTFYNYNVPKVVIFGSDTVTTTNYNESGYADAAAFVNQTFNLQKVAEDDGIVYTYVAPEGEWKFEPDQQPTGGFYDMILYISNMSGLLNNNFGVLKRPSGSNGRYWSGGGGKMNPFNGDGRKLSDGYGMRTMLSTFSGGGAGGGGGGLPIELLDFNAVLLGDQVELTWATATETNNEYFTIEKSDGKEFRQVAIIPGAGNSSDTKHYSKIDYKPFKGVSYYRLKQTDYQGKFAYSDVVSITYETDNSSVDDDEVVVFPNPSTGEFSLVLKKAAEVVGLSIFDANGNLLRKIKYSAPGNNFPYLVNIKGLKEGIYYLKIDVGVKTIYTKILIFGERS